FFQVSASNRDLHSFPTRRSSDLLRVSKRCAWFRSIVAIVGWVERSETHRISRQMMGSPCSTHPTDQILNLLYASFVQMITCSSQDRKSTRLNSSHDQISYAVFCL